MSKSLRTLFLKQLPNSRYQMEITEAQLNAIMTLTDNISAMLGGLDEDFNKENEHCVKMVDRFLNNHGIKRDFK